MVYSTGQVNADSITSKHIVVDDFTSTNVQKLSRLSKTVYDHNHSMYFYGPLVVFEYKQEGKIEEIATTSGTASCELSFTPKSEPRVGAAAKITFRLEGTFRSGLTSTDLNGIPFDELLNKDFDVTIPTGGVGVASFNFPTTTTASSNGDVDKTGGLYDDLRIVFTRKKYINMSNVEPTTSGLTDIYGEIDLNSILNMHP